MGARGFSVVNFRYFCPSGFGSFSKFEFGHQRAAYYGQINKALDQNLNILSVGGSRGGEIRFDMTLDMKRNGENKLVGVWKEFLDKSLEFFRGNQLRMFASYKCVCIVYTYRGRAERGCSCDSRPPTGPCLDRDGPLRRRLASAIPPREPVRPSSGGIDNPCDCGQK